MLPLGPRVAVARDARERLTAGGIVLSLPDMRFAYCGEVLAVGEPHRVRGKRLPLDVAVGERILYSSRVDSFVTEQGHVDIVEEASIIGHL
jgi:co-chaperonin GroES (HSP10)